MLEAKDLDLIVEVFQKFDQRISYLEQMSSDSYKDLIINDLRTAMVKSIEYIRQTADGTAEETLRKALDNSYKQTGNINEN